MMRGEFDSMTTLYKAMPDFAPKPFAWGKYESVRNTYFFICDFRDLDDDPPAPENFVSKLVELHQKNNSPNGQYGYRMTTFNGNLPQDNAWAPTWEEFFTKGMRHMLKLEEKSHGPNEELQKLSVPFFEKVIPRLLRPLETGGRSIKPSLVHGDLWYGNAATDNETEQPLIFDACVFYAHNECKQNSLLI
jgi:protein-ribulosamine 3-kinase